MSEVKVLNKEEFIQQYLLARANTINNGRSPDIDSIIERGAEAYGIIRERCCSNTSNVNKQ